jgi:glutaredoxin 3
MSKAVIYSKPSCPYCVRAKSILVSKNIEFEEVIYDGVSVTKDTIASVIGVDSKESSSITFPQIFIDGAYIGGFTDLCGKYGIKSKR